MSLRVPSQDLFRRLASGGVYTALVKKTKLAAEPLEIYRRLGHRRPSVLLESARHSPATGCYSIVAADPFLVFEYQDRKIFLRSRQGCSVVGGNPFTVLKRLLKYFAVKESPGHPPFTGGAIGYFAYESKGLLENRSASQKGSLAGLPEIYLLFFDRGVVFDHTEGAVYLFCCFRAGADAGHAHRRALKCLRRLEKTLTGGPGLRRPGEAGRARFKSGQPFRIQSSLSRSAFAEKVESAKRYIRQGEIFQANLSQCLRFPVSKRADELYETLRRVNPSSFFGLLDAGDFQIVSGSPERLVKLEKGTLQTRPIAGTRPRAQNADRDAALSLDLLLDEKERAEHIMLVDLERNDLGRVCEYGSVRVDELMSIEDYSHVKHIVSNVRGVLRHGLDAVDALKALFPGGTITGAPKIRCMQIIDELEPTARGPYTGSLGYFGFGGSMDFNILIRSLVIRNQEAFLHVGAGIVADSVPDREYEETLYKAEAVLSAVFGKRQTRRYFKACGIASGLS